jgi:hypothetical protein
VRSNQVPELLHASLLNNRDFKLLTVQNTVQLRITFNSFGCTNFFYRFKKEIYIIDDTVITLLELARQKFFFMTKVSKILSVFPFQL